MDEIRLILYLIIAIISIISLIGYGIKSSKLKKIGKSVLNSLSPHRTLTLTELEAIKSSYKRHIAGLTSNSQVYRVDGRYICQEIRYRHTTTKTHFLNGIEFLWQPEFSYTLLEENSAEFVLNDKGKAIILSLNCDYLLDREISDSNKCEKETKSATRVTKDSEYITRELNPLEEAYLNRSYKVFSAIIMALSLFLFTIGDEDLNYTTIVIAMVLFTIGTLLYIIPTKNKIRGEVKLLEINGEIKEVNGNAFIGRFPVSIDKSYKPNYGSIVTAQVYPHSKELDVNTLVRDDNWSISNYYQYKGIKNRGRVILLTVVLSIGLLLNIFNGNIPGYIKGTYNYITTRNLNSSFNSIEEIANYEFKDGQNVTLNNIKIVNNPLDDATYIVADSYNYQVGNKDILYRIDALRYVLYTELFLTLFVLENDMFDEVTTYTLALLSLTYDYQFSLYNFDTIYRDNEYYIYLSDFWENFQNGGDPGDYWTLVNSYNNFISHEVSYINSLIVEDISNSLKEVPKIKILGELDYSPNYISYMNSDYKPSRDVFIKMNGHIPTNEKSRSFLESRVNSYIRTGWNGHVYYDIKGSMGLNNSRNEIDPRHFGYIFLVLVSFFIFLKVILPVLREKS